VLPIGYEHFDRMTLHRCLDSSPIFFELFLIDGFSSREYNVSVLLVTPRIMSAVCCG
jgi:hypothetical protein